MSYCNRDMWEADNHGWRPVKVRIAPKLLIVRRDLGKIGGFERRLNHREIGRSIFATEAGALARHKELLRAQIEEAKANIAAWEARLIGLPGETSDSSSAH